MDINEYIYMELIGNIVFANETEEFTTKYEPVQGCWSKVKS